MNKNNLKRFNNFLDKLIPQGKLLPKGSKVVSMKKIENKLGKNKLKIIITKNKKNQSFLNEILISYFSSKVIKLKLNNYTKKQLKIDTLY